MRRTIQKRWAVCNLKPKDEGLKFEFLCLADPWSTRPMLLRLGLKPVSRSFKCPSRHWAAWPRRRGGTRARDQWHNSQNKQEAQKILEYTCLIFGCFRQHETTGLHLFKRTVFMHDLVYQLIQLWFNPSAFGLPSLRAPSQAAVQRACSVMIHDSKVAES